MKTIAIIPARGGSKRIPHKNIIDFLGKPMIAWTIEAALESKLFDRVLVSTDSQEIADVAIRYGSEVPFLRAEYADDITPVSEATLSALIQSEKYWQESYDCVVQLMANCPLRCSESIVSSFNRFQKSTSHFSISAFKFGWMNPWWAARLDNENKPSLLFPEAIKSRSQDLDDLYCPTGATWIASVEELKESRSFYGKNHIFTTIPWVEAVDIDDEDDLMMAKAAASLSRFNNG